MDWELRELTQQCAQCGCAFHEGDAICSAVFEREEGFERLDFCESCHNDLDPGIIYARWRTLQPQAEEPPLHRAVNESAVRDFFGRLAGEDDPGKRNFRYVLGLMLMRKKVLRYVEVRRGDEGTELVLRERRTDEEHVVFNPCLGEEEILALTEKVGQVLNVRVEVPAEVAETQAETRAETQTEVQAEAGGES